MSSLLSYATARAFDAADAPCLGSIRTQQWMRCAAALAQAGAHDLAALAESAAHGNGFGDWDLYDRIETR
jgi:hypothetical protein